MVQEDEMTEKLETLPGLQFCPFEGASTGSALWRGDNSGFFSLPLLSPLSTPLPLSLMMLNQILSLLMNHTFEYLSDSGVRPRHNLSFALRLGSSDTNRSRWLGVVHILCNRFPPNFYSITWGVLAK